MAEGGRRDHFIGCFNWLHCMETKCEYQDELTVYFFVIWCLCDQTLVYSCSVISTHKAGNIGSSKTRSLGLTLKGKRQKVAKNSVFSLKALVVWEWGGKWEWVNINCSSFRFWDSVTSVDTSKNFGILIYHSSLLNQWEQSSVWSW